MSTTITLTSNPPYNPHSHSHSHSVKPLDEQPPPPQIHKICTKGKCQDLRRYAVRLDFTAVLRCCDSCYKLKPDQHLFEPLHEPYMPLRKPTQYKGFLDTQCFRCSRTFLVRDYYSSSTSTTKIYKILEDNDNTNSDPKPIGCITCIQFIKLTSTNDHDVCRKEKDFTKHYYDVYFWKSKKLCMFSASISVFDKTDKKSKTKKVI